MGAAVGADEVAAFGTAVGLNVVAVVVPVVVADVVPVVVGVDSLQSAKVPSMCDDTAALRSGTVTLAQSANRSVSLPKA